MITDVLTARGYSFLGSRLKRLAERLQADAGRINRAAGLDIAPAQFQVLAALDHAGPLPVTALGEALGISQPAATRTALGLIDLGLVTGTRDSADLRHKVLALTDAGSAAIATAKTQVWPHVDAALRAICDPLQGPLLDQIAGLERALDAQSLDVRVGARSAPGDLTIRGYDDSLADDFYRINVEWIETMFTVEANDVAILTQPRALIIDRDGVILFVESPTLGVIGTCALIKVDDGCYELTKMGVRESARGLKAGEFLLAAVLARAAAMHIDMLYLLTNTKCAAAIHLYEKLGFRHDADIMARFGSRYERCNVAMAWRPGD